MVWDKWDDLKQVGWSRTSGMVWDKSLTWPGIFMNGLNQTEMVWTKSLTWPRTFTNGAK